MKINKSYRIWTAPRTGHTLFAKMLEMTGRAGRPGEHLTLHGETNFQEKYGVSTYKEIKEKIWKAGSDGNSTFACKIDGHAHSINLAIQEVMELKGGKTKEIEDDFWSDLFPNCKDIYLTRRNKVRQAVSWWKAIQDGTWHLKKGEKRDHSKDFYQDKYVHDAVKHLYIEAGLREASIQEYFTRNGITAMTIIYEDFIVHPERTILETLNYLEIYTDHVDIPEFPFKKTADDVSEEWVNRFRNEIQEGWDKKAW